MDLFKAITTRRSIRFYKNKPIEKDDLYLLVEMGLKAPSAGDLQDFRFIVSRNKDLINKLPAICMDQVWITSAPAIIVVCSQPQRQGEWFGERGKHVFATQNASAAIQNILLTAHSIGLGACWIGGFDQEKVDSLFGVTGKGRVEGIITIGWAAEKPDRKDEVNIREAMYYDKFGNGKDDKSVIQKDYSVKVEKYLNKAEKEAKSQSKTIFSKISKKIKDHKDRYMQKVEDSHKYK